MRVRASVVLPAPRSPESVTTSPASSALATSIARRRVACSSGSATEKLELLELVMAWLDGRWRGLGDRASRGGSLGRMGEREDASDGGAAADRRFERHRAAV